MATTEIQFDKIHEELEWIREDIARTERGEPATDLKWGQASWLIPRFDDDDTGRLNICNSYGCIAGHVAIKAGAKVVRMGADGDQASFVEHLGIRRSFSQVAMEELGLDADQAEVLFHAHNTLDDLEAIVKGWENGDTDSTRDELLDRQVLDSPFSD